MKKTIVALLVLGAVAFLATACQRGLAARVNGAPIYDRQINEQIAVIQKQPADNFKMNLSDEQVGRLRAQVLDNLITTELILQQADKAGLRVTNEEIDKRVGQLRANYQTEKAFDRYLGERGLTPAKLRDTLKARLLTDKMRAKIVADVRVTDKDLDARLKDDPDLLKEPPTWQIRQIAVKDKGRARKVLKELKSGGDFAELAKKYSTGQAAAASGGEVGWLTRRQMGEIVYKAVEKLEPGENSEIVKLPAGYFVYQLGGYREETEKSLEDFKPRLKQRLLLQKQQSAWTKWLAKIKKEADITKTGS